MTNIAVFVPPAGREPAGDRELAHLALRRHLPGLPWLDYDTLGVPDELRTARGYNPLMLSRALYHRLYQRGFTHMLVYQSDAVVFRGLPILEELANTGFDYFGAPHDEELGLPFAPGNGGLSLRRLEPFVRALDGRPDWIDEDSYYRWIAMNEDVWWSFHAPIRPCTIELAIEFSWETHPSRLFALNSGRLPFGAHAYRRYEPEFWDALGGVWKIALGPLPNHENLPGPGAAGEPPEHQQRHIDDREENPTLD